MSTLTSFVLTPQVTNPDCVIADITITPAGDDGVIREDIPVAIEDLGVAILVDGYDVCLYTYNFTIVATTLADELRTTVSQDDPVNLSGTLIIVIRHQKSISEIFTDLNIRFVRYMLTWINIKGIIIMGFI